MQYHHTWGFSAALLAAVLWAVSTYLYQSAGTRISPLRLNLLKGCLASGVLAVLFGVYGELLPDVPSSVYILLLLSGAVGIGIGDTAFFHALNRLGARQTVLLTEAAAPLMTLALAIPVCNERLPGNALVATLIVLLGVALAIRARDRGRGDEVITARGLSYVGVAAAGQAIGAVMSKLAFLEAELSPLWCTLVRLVGGTIVLVPFVVIGRPAAGYAPLDARMMRVVVAASMIGTVGGISLLQAAFKYTYTGTAQALASTVSLFVLAIAVVLGHRPSRQAWLGTAIAVGGIVWLFAGS